MHTPIVNSRYCTCRNIIPTPASFLIRCNSTHYGYTYQQRWHCCSTNIHSVHIYLLTNRPFHLGIQWVQHVELEGCYLIGWFAGEHHGNCDLAAVQRVCTSLICLDREIHNSMLTSITISIAAKYHTHTRTHARTHTHTHTHTHTWPYNFCQL